MASAPTAGRPSRFRTVLVVPLAGLLLTAFFVFLGFPYELLALRLSDQVARAADVELRIGELRPHVGFAGPGFAAREVLAERAGSPAILLDELVIRPAWSLAWLRGMLALHLDVTSEMGNGTGTLTLGRLGGWEGQLESVRLEYLPLAAMQSLDVQGRLTASVDLHRADEERGGALVGQVLFDVRDGSLAAEGMPMAVPFERLYGQLEFGDESFVRVSGVRLEGPMISGTIEGQVGHAPAPGRQPLDLDLEYQINDPRIAGMLAAVGNVPAEGGGRLSIGGTVSRPVVR